MVKETPGGRILKRVLVVVVLVLVLGFAGRAVYGCVPARELAAADASLKESACAQPSSTTPPDDAWRAARDHVERASGYRLYREEVSAKSREIYVCCIRAYFRFENLVQEKASAVMNERNRRAGTLVATDWRAFVTAQDRELLCNGPWKECEFADEKLCTP
jgi:hypothetical protein